MSVKAIISLEKCSRQERALKVTFLKTLAVPQKSQARYHASLSLIGS